MTLRNHAAWILGAALLGACAVDDTSQDNQDQDSFSREPSDDVVITLNNQAIAAIGAAAPFAATRFMGAVHIAIYEGVDACTRDYAQYFGISAARGCSPEAAAIVAGH